MTNTGHSELQRNAVIEIEPGDLIAMQQLALRTNLRKDYRNFVVLWAVCVAIFSVIVVISGDAVLPALAVFAPAAAIGVVLVPWLLTWLFGPMSARKTYRVQKSLHGPVDLNWDDTMLRVGHDSGDARVRWANLYRAAEDDKLFLLYESDRLYRMIPKRYLSEAQIADIQAIIGKI